MSGFLRVGIMVLCLGLCPAALAGEAVVAAAANFSTALDRIQKAFQARTGHKLRISLGSSGKLYAQIVNGAPYDAFFAADAERPARLETAGKTIPGSRYAYALGRLAL